MARRHADCAGSVILLNRKVRHPAIKGNKDVPHADTECSVSVDTGSNETTPGNGNLGYLQLELAWK